MVGTLVTTLHVIVALLLILVVLLQTGKGASMGAAFGGSSQTVFGSRGPASFMSKLTTAGAILFMATSLLLSVITAKTGKKTVVDDLTPPAATQTAPEPGAIDPFAAGTDAMDSAATPQKGTGEPEEK